MYSIDPRAIPTATPQTNAPGVEQRVKDLAKAHEEPVVAHELARQKMKQQRNDKTIKFKPGDKVWLDGQNLNIPYPSQKLALKREGPFEVICPVGMVAYKLKLPTGWKIHNTFHTMLLSPYTETNTHGPNFLRPLPILVKGDEEYEVEAILAHQKRGNSYQYLIKWKNYSSNDNMWEPEAHLTHAKMLL
jgi:hypothetical protein